MQRVDGRRGSSRWRRLLEQSSQPSQSLSPAVLFPSLDAFVPSAYLPFAERLHTVCKVCKSWAGSNGQHQSLDIPRKLAKRTSSANEGVIEQRQLDHLSPTDNTLIPFDNFIRQRSEHPTGCFCRGRDGSSAARIARSQAAKDLDALMCMSQQKHARGNSMVKFFLGSTIHRKGPNPRAKKSERVTFARFPIPPFCKGRWGARQCPN